MYIVTCDKFVAGSTTIKDANQEKQPSAKQPTQAVESPKSPLG